MPNPHPLTGQAALVTGGTRGIGRAVAASFLEAGAQVVLTGTRREAAEEVAAEHSTADFPLAPAPTAPLATSPMTRASRTWSPSSGNAAAGWTFW